MRSSVFFLAASLASSVLATTTPSPDSSAVAPRNAPAVAPRQSNGGVTQFASLQDALSAIFGGDLSGLKNGSVFEGHLNPNGSLTGSFTNATDPASTTGDSGVGGFLGSLFGGNRNRNNTITRGRNKTASSVSPRGLTAKDLAAMAEDNGLIPTLKEKRQSSNLPPEIQDLLNQILSGIGAGRSRNGTASSFGSFAGVSGNFTRARGGRNGTSRAGRNGTSRAGRNGTSRAGRNGTSRAGRNGTSRAGRNSTARAGRNNTRNNGAASLFGRVPVAKLEAVADAFNLVRRNGAVGAGAAMRAARGQ